MNSMIEVSTQRQLFFDDYVIEDTVRVRRTFHSVKKHPGNPLITRDQPWEHGVHCHGSMVSENNTFRIWYLILEKGAAGREGNTRVAYAESQDGITWQKPSLGILQYQGSTDNSLVMIGGMEVDGVTMTGPFCSDPCIRKQRHEVDPDNKYKMLYRTQAPGIRGLCLAFSPDGLRWRPYCRNPVIWGWSDCQNHFFFDQQLGKYVAYMRPFVRLEQMVPWRLARVVARSESADLTNWSMPDIVLRPGELDFNPLKPPEESLVQLYGMVVFPYEDIYIGLVKVYNRPKGTIHVELAYSRDNYHWIRPPARTVFIPVGLEGKYNGYMIHPVDWPMQKENELWFYFAGMSFPHYGVSGVQGDPFRNDAASGIGLGTLRRDGFVSLEAGELGVILTRPFYLW